MNHRVFWFSFLVLWAVNTPVYSIEVRGLYSASVKVKTQNVRERRIASQDALAEVFIRASGHAAAVNNDDIRLILTKADQFIISYAYQAIEHTDEDAPTDLNEDNNFLLLLDFDSVQVNKSLRAANLPVWGSNRPQLLMWWAIEDQENRRLVNSDNDIASLLLIENHAKKRGIPLSWPLLDLTDKELIGTSDIWSLSLDKVMPASERYGSQAVIMGRARVSRTGRWFGSWVLLINGQQFWLDGDGSDLNSLMQQAINFSADVLAEQYAVTQSSDNSGGIILKITGVDTLNDYAELNNYLVGLSSVLQLTLKAVDQNNIWYSLTLESNVANFEQVVRLDKRLQKRMNEDGLEIDESRLEYRWTGL